MVFKARLVITAVAAFSACTANVVLSGSARDCFDGREVPVRGVKVSAFDLGQAQQLMGHLKTMDRATFAEGDFGAMDRFGAQYSRMISLVDSTKALARTISDTNGVFGFTVTAVDTVLIVGHLEIEDEPYYHSYKSIPGRSTTPFTLDMSRGTCSKPSSP